MVAAPEPALVAVLAGGMGRRLGGSKALAELGGRTLISYPLAAANEAGLESIIVAKRDTELPRTTAFILREPDTPRHPLLGVIAALRHTESSSGASRAVVALGCDMPFLNAPMLRWLATREDEAALARFDERVQPLPCLCRPPQIDALADHLEAGHALRVALAALRPRMITAQELSAFGDPRRLLFSVNEPEDLEAARRWIAGGP